MLCAMSSNLAALEARHTLQTMNRLRGQIQAFAAHAKVLNSSAGNFDSAALLNSATELLEQLGKARLEFIGAENKIDTLARTLPSRPPKGVVAMSPRQQWVPELRAAKKQFADTVHEAEQAIGRLRGTAFEGLNSPTRTATAPDGLLDILLNFTDLLTRWIEYRRRGKR